MNNITQYIIEKLKLNKDINLPMKKQLMELLRVNTKDQKVIDEIWELFDSDCYGIVFNKQESQYLCSSTFELLFMIAVMLKDDGYDLKALQLLGTEKYQGYSNPYVYTWFEEDIKCEGDTCSLTILEAIQYKYETDHKVKDLIEKIYNLTKKYIDATEDDIWGIVDILYDEDPDYKLGRNLD